MSRVRAYRPQWTELFVDDEEIKKIFPQNTSSALKCLFFEIKMQNSLSDWGRVPYQGLASLS